MAGGDGLPLGFEHDLIERGLGRREAAADGKGAREVGGVVLDFAARVNQHEILGIERRRVGRVMQHAGVGPGRDDGGIGGAPGAAAQEGIEQLRFEVSLPATRRAMPHGAQMALDGNGGGAAHQFDLGSGLEQAQFMKQGL